MLKIGGTMRKRIILCFMVFILYVVVGCGKNAVENTVDVTEAVKTAENETDNVKEESEIEVPVTGEEKAEVKMETGEENPYFPATSHMALKVRASYYKGQGLTDKIVDAEINRLKVYENGSIYKLEINIDIETASSDFPGMVRYFYVKADEIDLIWPFYQAEPNGKVIRFYDDDELLLDTFDTEEKLQDKGQLEPVCKEENTEYEDKYWFCYMKKEEDQITYYRREMRDSGDDMQKDLFVWEKGKGLIKFETGFGPGPMEASITEISADGDEVAENVIHVTAEELQGNILGYSLLRYSPNPENAMYYERDMSYLVEEEFVGKGIYISDYMCETEVFLGSILKEVLADRGVVSGENRQYFTEYALGQLKEVEWETLDAQWSPDLWTYDRYYSAYPLSGGGGYQFSYYFFGNDEKTAKEEINQIALRLYVDVDGKICEMGTRINTVPTKDNRIEIGILENGLFDEGYSELVIWEGTPCMEKMKWDFERYFRRFMYNDEIYEQKNKGLLQSGNASSSAEELADIFLRVMKSRGADVEQYAGQFGFEKDFLNFAHTDWGALGENWTVSEGYDCFFTDRIQGSGYVGFQYYFYPDFQTMGVDEAMMVAIGCNVDCSEGKIDYNTVDIFPIMEETYEKIRKKQKEDRVLVVEEGMLQMGKDKVDVPVIDRELQYRPISEFDAATVAAMQSNRRVKEEFWGFTDTAEAAAYLREKFLQDFAEEQYDCFHIKTNEVAECLHLQYYFYPERNGEEQIKSRIMVVDVFLSEQGIEKMEVNEFCEG